MHLLRNPRHNAKHALFLVGWILCVCLAQNSGVSGFCNNLGNTRAIVENAQVSDDNEVSITAQCELSQQLLSFNYLSFDDLALPFFILALAIILWLTSAPHYFPPHTEPIRLRRRLHLRLCVFRE